MIHSFCPLVLFLWCFMPFYLYAIMIFCSCEDCIVSESFFAGGTTMKKGHYYHLRIETWSDKKSKGNKSFHRIYRKITSVGRHVNTRDDNFLLIIVVGVDAITYTYATFSVYEFKHLDIFAKQKVLTHVLEEAGYTKDSVLVPADFMKVISADFRKTTMDTTNISHVTFRINQ